jgi:hypothetical protein
MFLPYYAAPFISPFSTKVALISFNKVTIGNIIGNHDRIGWYLQQLLKLYALIIIPEILEKCLILDSDTFFLKPTIFINNNKCLYAYSEQYHTKYFEHMLKMDKELIKIYNKSGICHHMMFEKKYINELINKIEKNHNDTFYNVFLKMVTEFTGSGASEYEIYFNYMLKNYSNHIEIRELDWIDSKSLDDIHSHYDYISYHWHSR